MTDRPILFSAPMVRALLDGRKSQTRRIIVEQDHRCRPECREGRWKWRTEHCALKAGDIRLAFGVGDRLWVREGLMVCTEELPDRAGFAEVVCWQLDGNPVPGEAGALVDWPWERERLPAIFMPRWASRLTLVVTDVRVERLQDIREADARAEGVRGNASGPWGCEGLIEDFSGLWNSIHGPDAWEANPWVCALTFTVHPINIGSMPQ